jgi:hypothetical protein
VAVEEVEVEDQEEEEEVDLADQSVLYVEEHIKIETAPTTFKYQTQYKTRFVDIVLDVMLLMHVQR